MEVKNTSGAGREIALFIGNKSFTEAIPLRLEGALLILSCSIFFSYPVAKASSRDNPPVYELFLTNFVGSPCGLSIGKEGTYENRGLASYGRSAVMIFIMSLSMYSTICEQVSQ